MLGPSLRDREFRLISGIVYDRCRLNLHKGKKALVQSRLSKRLRSLGIENFREYLDYVQENDAEFSIMLDCLTTNYTGFYREPQHFEFLTEVVFPQLDLAEQERIRFWSAGCSSGEEAYSVAIEMKKGLSDIEKKDTLILATDISTRMLDVARTGVYEKDRLANCPPDVLRSFFAHFGPEKGVLYRVRPEVAGLVRFRHLNLVGPWPMKRPFDVIFCRNVMIYFDKATRRELVHRFWEALKPGGILIVGHCESLASIEHAFEFLSPTIYMKRTDARS
ncbi:MAG: protein-glutamate O-methyltransferase CheR [Actinobacteria bacterium]|nr:protein-glutamate O-methyltransferase CheR [Actinomycetota bacterium]